MINKIVIHCSDTPNGREHGVDDIRRWHKERGWSDVGYHAVIKINGDIELGRDSALSGKDFVQGAHVAGHNKNSIGICLIGRDEFTKDQMLSLEGLVMTLKSSYPDAEVLGHADLDSGKTCPNFDVKNWWSDVSAWS